MQRTPAVVAQDASRVILTDRCVKYSRVADERNGFRDARWNEYDDALVICPFRIPADRQASMTAQPCQPAPAWIRRVLVAAAVYNIAWGLFMIAAPRLPFEWAGMAPPNYPSLFQCIGMIVGVYGVGYAIAAGDPVRHWPIVLVGLLGKIFGPAGFVWAASRQELPWIAGLTILTNDIAWWLPFALILRYVARTENAT